uniref:Uncharacterized protein n=1 Tax=Strigamia maritima TaxID=126957 RepID=T1IZ36_STRMM
MASPLDFRLTESGLDEQSDRVQRLWCVAILYYMYDIATSMYFDEDGDLAHEFYVEENSSGRKATMRKINSSCLKPQGEIDHQFPRLRFDFPIVLYEE